MGQQKIRVTVEDLETGDCETKDILDDYVIITAGSCEVSDIQIYPTSGTHVLTVKGVRPPGASPDWGGRAA